jgi:hypothetical protein
MIVDMFFHFHIEVTKVIPSQGEILIAEANGSEYGLADLLESIDAYRTVEGVILHHQSNRDNIIEKSSMPDSLITSEMPVASTTSQTVAAGCCCSLLRATSC